MTIDASRPAPAASRPALYAARFSLLLILLLAAYLRLNHLEWTEFKLDEAHLSQLAYDMARHGQIPLTGIGSSVGVVNLPLAAWLLAVPYALSPSPIVATGFIAALNVLAVLACYGLARKMFNSSGAALTAALLFAVAPWAIVYSRKLWANDFLPLFVVGWAWTGWLTFVRRKPWWLIAHAALLGACIQLHYSALMLALVSAGWFAAFVRRVSWRAVLIATLVFALLFVPFLIADAQLGSPNVTRFRALFQQPATTDTSAVSNAWRLTTGLEVHSLAGPQEFENFRALVPWIDGISWLVGLMVVAGLMVSVIDVLRAIPQRKWADRSAVAFQLATWLLIPVVGQLSHRTSLYVHYFLPILPAPFMVAGYLVARRSNTAAVVKRGGRGNLAPTLLMMAVAIIALAQTVQTITLQQFVASRPTPGAMGIPIGYYERIVNEAKAALNEEGDVEIIVNTRGSNVYADEYPAIFNFLLNDVPHRFVDVTQAMRVYPPLSHIQIDYAPYGPITFAEAGRDLVGETMLRAGEQPGRVYRSGGYTALPCEATNNGHWQNGVTLLSAQIDPLRPGQQAAVYLCLKIDQPASDEYHWTAQLWDQSRRRWAQVDDNGYPSCYWRAGDVITQALKLDLPADLPAGDYVLRIGQYTWPEVKPVLLLDVAGNPYSDAVEVPLRVDN